MMPKFMVHDRWSNVLFLHWRVPPDHEPLLQSHCGNFVLDRTPDGSAWIGLVLLTERNVGPAPRLLRSFATCVTHHGVNVRTYVRGVRGREDERTRGIHFSSLECDDRLTAFGANIFGMPYKVASIQRRHTLGLWENSAEVADVESAEQRNQKIQQMPASERDELVDTNGTSYKMHLSSVRTSEGSSLFDLLLNALFHSNLAKLHGTELHFINSQPERAMKEVRDPILNGSLCGDSVEEKQTTFSVECEWERCPKSQPSAADTELIKFLVERYFVYTRKYWLNWRGMVEHQPWPVERARLLSRTISGIECYQPKQMQPLISYMGRAEPDSVLFSPGVGPIEFNMLRPV